MLFFAIPDESTFSSVYTTTCEWKRWRDENDRSYHAANRARLRLDWGGSVLAVQEIRRYLLLPIRPSL